MLCCVTNTGWQTMITDDDDDDVKASDQLILCDLSDLTFWNQWLILLN